LSFFNGGLSGCRVCGLFGKFPGSTVAVTEAGAGAKVASVSQVNPGTFYQAGLFFIFGVAGGLFSFEFDFGMRSVAIGFIF